MVLSDFAKLRILSLRWKQYTVSAIVECLLLDNGIQVSKQGVGMFLKRYKEHGTIPRKPGSGTVCCLAPAVQRIIEQAMEEDAKLQQHNYKLGCCVCIIDHLFVE